ncbi:hypothetical protein C1645_826912 [Glomus cerebriforme]|uniref:FAR1 domain-containing protein n=1 Tax=Glomus cerebriforme TaxID=658196 RepID=A0A397SPZ3_9GLOM|nr:hypothetical protein C1645_826912 [Glomus cerebriforme]
MENIVPNTNTNFSYTSDLLFNSYYDSSYNDSDLFTIYQYNSPDLPIFEFYGSSYDSSDLFLDHEIYNETQIGNKRINVLGDENICRYDILEVEDRNVDHQEKEYNNSDYEKEEEEDEKEEENELKLSQGIEFITWKIAESYLNKYAKQQGFLFKVILEEDKRDRDSEMIGYF